MNPRTKRRWLILAALLSGGAWIGARLWHTHRLIGIAHAGLPPRPDGSRWSAELTRRVAEAEAGVRRSTDAQTSLGQLARLYLVNGYPKEAETTLLALVQLDAGNPRWSYYLADVRLKAGDRLGALEWLRDTSQLAPEYVPALILRGELLIRENQFLEARSCFQTSLLLAPADPRVESNLAHLDGIGGDLRRALQRIDGVLKARPDYGPAHRVKAELLVRQGDAAGAAEERRKESACPPFAAADPWLEALYPECYDVNRLQMIIATLCRSGRYEDALPYLQRSVELSPAESTFYEGWAMACNILGRFEETRAILERGIAAAPDDFNLPVHLARALCRLQQTDEALAVVDRALGKWPQQAEVIAARGRTLLAAERPVEAVAAFQATLAINSGLPEVQVELGRSLMRLDRVDEARALFEQALQMRPDYAEVLILLAGIALQAGEIPAGENYTTQLLMLLPGDPRARRLKAEVLHLKANELAGEGHMEAAETAYRAGLDADPSSPLLHAGLGMVYVATGRPELALPELRLYVQLAPEDLQAHLVLAQALTTLQQNAEARQTLERGLAIARTAGDAEGIAAFEQLLKSL